MNLSRFKNRADWLAFLLLLLAAIFLFIDSPKQGDFWWSDASRHALGGGFFYEFFVSETPLSEIKSFAVEFYLRFPAISILFYPPLFALIESVFFLALGPSHFAAQLTVSTFYLGLLMGVYGFSRQWVPRLHALAMALLFGGAASIVFWGQQVMLEIPAYTFLIWAAYLFLSFLKASDIRFLLGAILVFILGLYTKMNIIFMAPVFLLMLYKKGGSEIFKTPAVAISLSVAGILLLPLIYSTMKYGQINVGAVMGGQASGEFSRFSLENWFYYLEQIPSQLGWMNMALLFGAAVAGPKATRLLKAQSPDLLWFLAGWFIVGYLFFSLIALKEPRHSIFILFPLIFTAGLFISKALPSRIGGIGLLLCAVIGFFYSLCYKPVPYVRNYKEAADFVATTLPPGYRVMIHSYWDGNFIFNLWTHEARRDLAVIRSDKILLKMAVKRSMGVEEQRYTDARIRDLLDQYGIYYVICERGFWNDLAIMRQFQNILEGKDFEPVFRIKLETNFLESRNIVIYRNLTVPPGPFKLPDYALPVIGAKIQGGRLKQ